MKKILLAVMMAVMLCGQGFAADEWLKSQPAGTDLINDLDVIIQENNTAIDRVLSNFGTIGLVYSSASAITATSGGVVCSNSDGSVRKMRLNTSTTSVGWGDIDTGAEAAGTTYIVWALCDADATTATFKISTSTSAPSGATSYAKIGSFYNNASSDIDQNKIYSEPYGAPFTDASGIPLGGVVAAYDYGSSASSSTRRNPAIYYIAHGAISVSADSTATISSLPFTSSSSFTCTSSFNDNTTNDDGYAGCAPASASTLTIINQQGAGARTINWTAVGY